MSSCIIHPNSDPIGTCERCGRVICENCRASKPEKPMVCNICHQKKRAKFFLWKLLLLAVFMIGMMVVFVVLMRSRFDRSPEISVYDGNAWHTYTQDDGISLNGVINATADAAGDVWFAGGAFGGGINRFDPEQQTWTEYSRHPVRLKFSNETPMYSNWVRDVTADGNVIWAATAVGVLRFEDGIWEALAAEDARPIFDVMAETCGRNSDCIFTARNGNQPDVAVWTVAADEGQMWAAIDDGSLSHFDGKNWLYLPVQDVLGSNPNRGLESYERPISALAFHNDVLWIGTLNQGVLRYDSQNRQHFDTAMGLPADRIDDLTIFADRVWLATPEGVAWIDIETEAISILDDLKDVNTITGTSERAYFASDVGLIELDLESNERIVHNTAIGLSDKPCYAVTVDSVGQVWVATEHIAGSSRADVLFKVMLMLYFFVLLILGIGLFSHYRSSSAQALRQQVKQWGGMFGSEVSPKKNWWERVWPIYYYLPCFGRLGL